MSVGFRILKRQRKVDIGTVERFARLPVANVSDSMSRMTGGGARLRPMHRAGGLAGPALTVKAPPGDNPMVHKAIVLAEPGDIIVVDAGGDLTNAITGEMMLMQMIKRRVAGLIINGAGYTHTSVAIMDALLSVDQPVIEVHLSNLFKREEFRHHSYISQAATGMICGLGAQGYLLAVDAMAELLKAKA